MAKHALKPLPLSFSDITWECGLHSGYPACCIRYFVETWWPLQCAETQRANRIIDAIKKRIQKAEEEKGVQFQHVPCPRCLEAGRAIIPKKCPPECSMFGSLK